MPVLPVPTIGLRDVGREALRRRRALEAQFPYAECRVEFDPRLGWTQVITRDLLEDGTVPITAVTWPG